MVAALLYGEDRIEQVDRKELPPAVVEGDDEDYEFPLEDPNSCHNIHCRRRCSSR